MRFYKNSINISIMLPVLIALSGGGGDWSESADSHRILRLPKRADFLFRQIVIAIWWFHPFASQFFFHNKNLKLWGRCETLKVLYFVLKKKIKLNPIFSNESNEWNSFGWRKNVRQRVLSAAVIGISVERDLSDESINRIFFVFFIHSIRLKWIFNQVPPVGLVKLKTQQPKTLWLCAVQTDNEHILGR